MTTKTLLIKLHVVEQLVNYLCPVKLATSAADVNIATLWNCCIAII